MNIETILNEYDGMFGRASMEEIETYLRNIIEEAREKSEVSVLFTILNEMIGFCRDTTQKEKALRYCQELLELLAALCLEGTVEYATALLNIANAYRAFGLLKEAVKLFAMTEQIYDANLGEMDFSYANLYNNWGLVYQELEAYDQAKETLLKALRVVDSYPEAVIPQATTRTNLAASLLQMGSEDAYAEAIGYLQQALTIHEQNGRCDFHYGAVLVAMGDAYCFKQDYEQAAKYYKLGMEEIEKHVGRTENYDRVAEKYQYARRKQGAWCSNLERSRLFYEQAGKRMIRGKFPEYESRIAVGLVGEGSDCYGFDDAISTDHDYGVGFCMWLTREDYEAIGKDLQQAYDDLIEDTTQSRLQNRRGVFRVDAFYETILGMPMPIDYDKVEEFQLSQATNGAVFQDELGVFSAIREQLMSYYPETVWRKRLAQKLHEFSQYAQSNYPRMMARGDGVTAQICVAKAVEAVMDLLYLLDRKYAPYYKWKKRGLKGSALAEQVLPLLEEIVALPSQMSVWEGISYQSTRVYTQDACVRQFERVAEQILQELRTQQLITGKNVFLEAYVSEILEGGRKTMVDKIVALEWKQFDRVKNEGGRADCQDDFETFSIMRKSQYLTWTPELLRSFYADLQQAEQTGWNLIMEKYARMMKSTNPEKYLELAEKLPVRSEERVAIQEEIIRIQVEWMEAFAKEYPKMAGNMRVIRTEADGPYQTSYETYLRGELGTYSENTFVLYSRFIVGLLQEGRNLAFEIMEQTAKLYGYASVADAEEKQ